MEPIEPAATKRKGGRPRGAKTNPAIKAATRARKTEPIAAPTDDLAAQLAAAAVPDPRSSAGGRPSTDERGRNKLAASLSTAYEGFGGMLAAGGRIIAGINPRAGQRLADVGRELVTNADRCGLALARWADSNKRVKEWLDNIATGSGALMVIAAHAPILAAVVGRADAAPLVAAGADLLTGDANPADFLGAFMAGMVNEPTVEPATAAA